MDKTSGSHATVSPSPERSNYQCQIKDISFHGKKLFTLLHPDICIRILVDGQLKVAIENRKRRRTISWNDVFNFNVQSTSSRVEISLLSLSKRMPEVIADCKLGLTELTKSVRCNLNQDGSSLGHLNMTVTVTSVANDPLHSPATEDTLALPTKTDTHVSLETRIRLDAVAQGIDQNPTFAVTQVLRNMKQLVAMVDKVAEVQPICNMAWKLLSSGYKIWENLEQQNDAVRNLALAMRDMLAFVDESKELDADKIGVIKKMGEAIEKGARLIDEISSSSSVGRGLKSTISSDVSDRLRLCQSQFNSLKEDYDRLLRLRTFKAVGKLQTDSLEREQRELLAKLPDVEELRAGFNRVNVKCLSGTRTDVLSAILDAWLSVNHLSQPRIFWLHGLPGMGKSTIAATVAERLSEEPARLGGSFFFSRSDAKRSDPEIVFGAIAHQLALRFPSFADGVCQSLRVYPPIVHATVPEQFQKLIAQPLKGGRRTLVPVVIVLDALDECADYDKILDVLREELSSLPPFFKILITSRPLSPIQETFAHMAHWPVDLSADAGTAHDIRRVLTQRLSEVAKKYSLENDWPGKERRDALLRKAGGLFIYVTIMVKYLDDEEEDDPEAQLGKLLDASTSSHRAWGQLDSLYLHVLRESFRSNRKRVSAVQNIIGTIVTAKAPLTVDAIKDLLSYDSDSLDAEKFVKSLQSVLSTSGEDQLIKIIHPSFFDFITDIQRCSDKSLFVDLKSQHFSLARRCLLRMNASLSYNICNVDRQLPNSLVQDLASRVSACISNALQYSCLYWAYHLDEGVDPSSEEIYDLLRTFYFKHLLHWFEVLSLVGAMGSAFRLLDVSRAWIKRRNDVGDDLLKLLDEAEKFLRKFRTPIDASAMHIYYSALPFTPADSLLYETYCQQIPRNSVAVLTPTSWSSPIEGHTDHVKSVAFSPDGSLIVSGSDDRTVRLWDGASGVPVDGPRAILKGHESYVRAVAFSVDGKRIVSGSADKTLRLWNTSTGEIIGELLMGHTGWINAVVFSPNGLFIASGSADHTVRLWDGVTGVPLRHPFSGHTATVNSIAFSPDGIRLVSASDDSTLLIWDVATGETVGQILDGQNAAVRSVAYSPDGAFIASGFKDGTIRLWNIGSGTSPSMATVLEGHDHSVKTVAFSPDSTRLASGSSDTTVRIWNLSTGEQIGDPFYGHSSEVSSVVFSPDGKRILSGSWDRTLRLWSVDDLPASSKREYAVSSVAISPIGDRVVSGSWDKTVRLWDAYSGKPIGPAVQCEFPVQSVRFSPDGSHVISATSGRRMTVWDLSSGKATLVHHQQTSFIFALSKDGNWIAIANTKDYSVRVWDGFNGQKHGGMFPGDRKFISAIAISPDGRRIVVGLDGNDLRLWKRNGSMIEASMRGHSSKITAVSFSKDAKKIVSASNDATIRLWDGETGVPIDVRFEDHLSVVTVAEFSPSGETLASGCADGYVWIWDSMTGQCLGKYQRLSSIKSLEFSEDNTQILSKTSNDVTCWKMSSSPFHAQGALVVAWRLGLSTSNGWVEGVDGRKLWWTPVESRGTLQACSFSKKLVSGNVHGQVTILDFEKVVENS